MEHTPVVQNDGTVDVEILQWALSAKMRMEVKVDNVAAEPGTTKGSNFLSDVWRVKFDRTITEQELQPGEVQEVLLPLHRPITSNVPHATCYLESIEKSVIAKCKPKNEILNSLMNTSIAFKNELFSYNRMIYHLSFYSNGALRTPLHIIGNENCILLEDMNIRSFYNVNKKIANDWNQVWSPLQEMAKLHASSLLLQKTNKGLFDDLVGDIEIVPIDQTIELGKLQATVIDTALKLLEEHADTIIYKKNIESLKEGAWKEQRNIIEREVPIRVINHGSIWINNLLYRKDMAVLLDWQHIVYSTPAIDLSFFLYVNLDADFLTSQRKKLLEFYLLNLHQNIYEVCAKQSIQNIDEILEPLTYNWIDSEFKRCSLYGYMMSLWVQPILYMSEASFDTIAQAGGIEQLPVEERLAHMTSDGKDRIIKLTKFYLIESTRN